MAFTVQHNVDIRI